MKNNKKDNPVPSLNKLYKDYRDSDICEGVESPEILQFLYYCKHKNLHNKTLKNFQNGVETNKEQPKCKNCNTNINPEEWCDECGYDQGN